MRRLAAVLIYPLLSVALGGCSGEAPSPESGADSAVLATAPPVGKLSKAAQKRLERKRELKLKSMVKRDPMAEPGDQ